MYWGGRQRKPGRQTEIKNVCVGGGERKEQKRRVDGSVLGGGGQREVTKKEEVTQGEGHVVAHSQ